MGLFMANSNSSASAGRRGAPSGRPLSPHLQIYRLLWNMTMSIVHRMTGAALYFGTLLLAAWLMALASGPDMFDMVNEFFASIVGRLILFGYSWALIHHMLGGLRHFVWDTGRGFDLLTVGILARATLIGSIGFTLLVWAIGYRVLGGS